MKDDAAPLPDLLDTAVQMAVALIPHVGGSLAVLAEHERVRFHERAVEFAAEVTSRAEREILDQALGERQAILVLRAAQAAGITDWAEKRRALAHDVADALTGNNDATLDDAELFVAAVADLQRAHVATLVRLADEPTAVTMSSLAPELHPSVVAGLARHGLIENVGIDGGNALRGSGGILYAVTTFGHRIIDLLAHPDATNPGPDTEMY